MMLLLIILGMAVVTYLPRMLPVLIIDRFTPPAWLNRWLKSIPYAALGALIFPGILTVDTLPWVGIIGGIVAVFLAFLRLHIILVIFGSIGAAILTKMWLS